MEKVMYKDKLEGETSQLDIINGWLIRLESSYCVSEFQIDGRTRDVGASLSHSSTTTRVCCQRATRAARLEARELAHVRKAAITVVSGEIAQGS